MESLSTKLSTGKIVRWATTLEIPHKPTNLLGVGNRNRSTEPYAKYGRTARRRNSTPVYVYGHLRHHFCTTSFDRCDFFPLPRPFYGLRSAPSLLRGHYNFCLRAIGAAKSRQHCRSHFDRCIHRKTSARKGRDKSRNGWARQIELSNERTAKIQIA